MILHIYVVKIRKLGAEGSFLRILALSKSQLGSYSCLKWRLEEIYNLISEHLTYSAIWVPNWNT